MAQITAAQLQSALDAISGHDVGSPSPVKVLQENHDSATYSRWYVEGNSNEVASPKVIYGERTMWVKTTVAGIAASQAAEVLTALDSNSNVDPDAQV